MDGLYLQLGLAVHPVKVNGEVAWLAKHRILVDTFEAQFAALGRGRVVVTLEGLSTPFLVDYTNEFGDWGAITVVDAMNSALIRGELPLRAYVHSSRVVGIRGISLRDLIDA